MLRLPTANSELTETPLDTELADLPYMLMGKDINTSGMYDRAGYCTTVFLPVEAGHKFYLDLGQRDSTVLYQGYDQNKTAVYINVRSVLNTYPVVVTIPSDKGIKYIAVPLGKYEDIYNDTAVKSVTRIA